MSGRTALSEINPRREFPFVIFHLRFVICLFRFVVCDSPQKYLGGYVYFAKSDADSLVLQMPIGNYICAIPFRKSVP